MAKMLTSHAVLGLAVSSALIGAMAGCSGSATSTEDPVVSTTSAAFTAACDNDDAPRVRHGVSDPGVRGGVPGGGGIIAGTNANEAALWGEGRFRSTEIEATCDTCADFEPGSPLPPGAPPDSTNSAGLGARFNSNTCTPGCHSQPALGGTSPFVNPSFAAAVAKGATNTVPFFEKIDGPSREVRFLFNPDGSRDGGVHQKFSVRGRSDAPSCLDLGQPDFEAQRGNMSFRIPTPMFGLGIMDSIPDVEILKYKNANLGRKAALGIHGATNNNGNTGQISRFGWKAQNASITMFAGEAYTVEMGVTNELFPISKVENYDCNLGAEPNDVTRTGTGGDNDFNNPLEIMSDWMMFSLFMRFTDQPTPAPLNASAQRGLDAFNQVGCSECHVPSMKTRSGPTGPQSLALRGVTANLYSDLLVHHMGAGLADNVEQGGAGPDQFRSSPLWGVGQRIFFLHDGRANTLTEAILAHYSPASHAHGRNPAYPASEANQVIRNFADLPAGSQQDLLNFLRSL